MTTIWTKRAAACMSLVSDGSDWQRARSPSALQLVLANWRLTEAVWPLVRLAELITVLVGSSERRVRRMAARALASSCCSRSSASRAPMSKRRLREVLLSWSAMRG